MDELRYLQPLRNLLRVFTAETSPRQLAAGIALGMLIGLLPKGNLLAVVASMLLFGLRVNLAAGLSATFLVTLIGPGLDRLTHGLGVHLLSTPTIYHIVRNAYDLPLVPWTDLNNTVVIGSLTLGLVLVYPVYHICRTGAELLLPPLRRYRERFRFRARKADATV